MDRSLLIKIVVAIIIVAILVLIPSVAESDESMLEYIWHTMGVNLTV